MPYIKKELRTKYDPLITLLLEKFHYKSVKWMCVDGNNRGGNDVWEIKVGDLNYIFSKIIVTLFSNVKNYETANALLGMLESVKQEFYRKHVAPYEQKKIKENGDIV